jgi:hypothetical protein
LTRFQEERVVRLVERHVENTLSGASLVDRLSRTEVGRLTDRVYTSLARRLLAERERRGLQ